MRVVKTIIYKYSELSEKAQRNAIDHYNTNDYGQGDMASWNVNEYTIPRLADKLGVSEQAIDWQCDWHRTSISLIPHKCGIPWRHILDSLGGSYENTHLFDQSGPVLNREPSKYLPLVDEEVPDEFFSLDSNGDIEVEVYELSSHPIVELSSKKCVDEFVDDVIELAEMCAQYIQSEIQKVEENIMSEFEYVSSDEWIIDKFEANGWEFTEEGNPV